MCCRVRPRTRAWFFIGDFHVGYRRICVGWLVMLLYRGFALCRIYVRLASTDGWERSWNKDRLTLCLHGSSSCSQKRKSRRRSLQRFAYKSWVGERITRNLKALQHDVLHFAYRSFFAVSQDTSSYGCATPRIVLCSGITFGILYIQISLRFRRILLPVDSLLRASAIKKCAAVLSLWFRPLHCLGSLAGIICFFFNIPLMPSDGACCTEGPGGDQVNHERLCTIAPHSFRVWKQWRKAQWDHRFWVKSNWKPMALRLQANRRTLACTSLIVAKATWGPFLVRKSTTQRQNISLVKCGTAFSLGMCIPRSKEFGIADSYPHDLAMLTKKPRNFAIDKYTVFC